MASYYSHRNLLEKEDAIQAATEGFLVAIQKYQPDKGAGLASYASFWIRDSLQKAANANLLVHVPAGLCKEVFAERRRGTNQNRKSSHLKKTKQLADAAFSWRKMEGDETFQPLDRLASDACDAGMDLDIQKLKQEMGRLPNKYQQILYQQYWLGLSMEQIGACYGISRQAVDQRKKQAIRDLRSALGAGELG